MSSPEFWCNPPPPGTTDEDIYLNSSSSIRARSRSPVERAIDQIDPYLKSTEYIKYQRRRRSRSRHRHSKRSRSRTRSKDRHRHRRRRHSDSRSRSRSRHRRHRHRSRSRSKSRNYRNHKSHKSRSRSRSRHRSKTPPKIIKVEQKEIRDEEIEDEEDEEENTNENVFKNDGTFMEMFKKMQEEQMKEKNVAIAQTSDNKPPAMPVFGKRRGGKILKTGMVQKNKSSNEDEMNSQDAWSLYMKEVKRYKEACCDDDSKTRLLVK